MEVVNENKELGHEDINTFRLYMKEIYRYKVLKREEIQQLFEEYHKGNQEAKEKIIHHNLRFVVSIANQYRNKGLPLEDLIQEGNVGLMVAIDRYDPSLGFAFSTYAYQWIRQAIGRALDEKSRLIRIPGTRLIEFGKALRNVETFREKYGVEPTEEQLKELVGMPFDVYQILRIVSGETISLDVDLSGEDVITGKDVLPDHSIVNTLDLLEQQSDANEIYRLLSLLSERKREVIMRRFGFYHDEQQTMEQIGKVLHVTRQRIKQMESQALKELRNHVMNQTMQMEVSNNNQKIRAQ